MNLRSGVILDKTVTQKKKKGNSKLQPAQVFKMTDVEELKHLILSTKHSISSELKEFRTELKEFRTETERDIKQIMQQNKQMSEELEKATGRLAEVECRISESLDVEISHHQVIKYLANKVVELEERTDYLENKSRQNNVRIFNVPERSEEDDMITFVKKLFRETLHLTGDIEVIRAHRLYRKNETHGRQIIVAFRDFNAKKRVLSTAWKMKEVIFKDTRIFFEHDFTAKVYQQRTAYKYVRKQLKDKNIKSHVLIPAKLKVIYEDGTAQIFETPQAAIKDLGKRGLINAATMEHLHIEKHNKALAQQASSSGHGDGQWERPKARRMGGEINELMQRAEKNLGLRE